MGRGFTLILGGVRSGKSDLAQKLALDAGGDVVFLATAEPRDAEMQARITAHQAKRPAGWRTVEAPRGVAEALERAATGPVTVVVDCLTLWVANLVEAATPAGHDEPDANAAEALLNTELGGFHDWYRGSQARVIVVTNEVGMGLVPPYPSGRLYRDLLGLANQRLATIATQVYVTFAGIPVDVKALAARPWREN